jgi:esterase/lipase superfamily enzyme
MMSSYIITTRTRNEDGTFGKDHGDDFSYLGVSDKSKEPKWVDDDYYDIRYWMGHIVDEAKKDNDANILFFVHGYNTSAEEALERQRYIEQGLDNAGVPTVVVGFDWPTLSSVAGYIYDRQEAHQAAHDLVNGLIIPFSLYNDPDCTVNVNILAHSMGNYCLREAFRTTDKIRKDTIPNDWRVNQIILVAADIASDSFTVDHPDVASMFNHCTRITNYYNQFDEALAVSNIKRVGLDPRLGRVGMPLSAENNPKSIDVNCSERYKHIVDDVYSLSNMVQSHSWYFDDLIWFQDLAHTITGIEHSQIPTRSIINNNLFQLNGK